MARANAKWLLLGVLGTVVLAAVIVPFILSGGGKSDAVRLTPSIGATQSATADTLSTAPASDSQVAHAYLATSAFISDVQRVAVKRTTWATFLPYSGLASLPIGTTADEAIDVVVQAGAVSPTAWGGNTIGNGHTYSFVVRAIDVNDPQNGPQTALTFPDIQWPPWLSALPGPETDATP